MKMKRKSKTDILRILTMAVAITMILWGSSSIALAQTVFSVPCKDGIGDSAALIAAIEEANQVPVGERKIELGTNCIYEFSTPIDVDPKLGSTALPIIRLPLIIEGNGSTLIRSKDSEPFRILSISNTSLTLQDLTIANGFSTVSGGGIFVAPGTNPRVVLTLAV